MDREDMIRMADMAGLPDALTARPGGRAMLEAFAALVAAGEREACANVCDARALRCEAEAQRAIENGEHNEVSAIRSTAWQISVCAADIRARGTTQPADSSAPSKAT